MKFLVKLTALGTTLASVVFMPTTAGAATPSNDDFSHPTVVSPGFPSSSSGSTVDATRASDDPDCGFAGTIWFSYTPRATRTVLATTVGSAYTASIGVYTGERGALTELACNNAAAFESSAVQVRVHAGTRYYFMVSGFSEEESGDIQLSIEQAPTMSVTLASTGTVDQFGLVTLHGRFTCDGPGVIFLGASGRQGEASENIAEAFLDCPAVRQLYEVSIDSDTETPFKAGRAHVQIGGSFRGYRGGTPQGFEIDKTVRLRAITVPE